MSEIFKLREYDLIGTKISQGNYYICTDSKKMYMDTSTSRVMLNVTHINTELDRLHNIRPNNGTRYYVWETNELWRYNAGWVLEVGTPRVSSGYYYANNQICRTDDDPIIDNNGLLKDGSVVIRDINRVIKGRAYIDGTNNNLVISSFLGGGIVLLPSGELNNTGCLEILSSNTYTGEFDEDGNPILSSNNGQMIFTGDIFLADYIDNERVIKGKVLVEEYANRARSLPTEVLYKRVGSQVLCSIDISSKDINSSDNFVCNIPGEYVPELSQAFHLHCINGDSPTSAVETVTAYIIGHSSSDESIIGNVYIDTSTSITIPKASRITFSYII